MTRTVNIAIVAALTLGAATIAAAVAGTTRAPRASDIPVMVTSRNATATVVPAGPPRTMPPATAQQPATPSHKPTGGPADPRTSTSVPRTHDTGASSSSGGARSEKTGDRDDDVEVVKPPVHEENESPDGYNSDEDKPDSD